MLKNIILLGVFGLANAFELTKYLRAFKSKPETIMLISPETEAIKYLLTGDDNDCELGNIKTSQKTNSDGVIIGYENGACGFVTNNC